jgi:universal stress protein E
MGRLDRILAVVDPTSDVQPALDKARLLARRSGATLELFISDYDPSLSGRPFFDSARLRELREEFLTERLEYLEELADDIRAGDLPVETHVHWGNPIYRGIVERVRQTSPDLVVKDTHHHSALRRTLFTNTDWNLIRACPAPLLLAQPSDWPARPRILAALDPEHAGDPAAALDRAILEDAGLLAQWLEAEVHVVHAYFPATLLAAVTGNGPLPLSAGAADVVERERERIGAVLAKVAAVDVLPRVARSLAADVLVMGAVSRSRLQELFVGSTAELVLDRLPCDVLVAKPRELRVL